MTRPIVRPATYSVLFYVLAAAACLIVYRGLGDSYLYNDDFRWMRQARYDMRWDNILTFQVIGFFRPLMNVVFYITERVMPGNIGAYYATGVYLHFLNGVILYHLVARLTGKLMLAGATALFFLITSTHWAAVGWISARTALISTGLLLLSMLVVAGRPPVRWRRWCSVALYLLALGAKEDAVIGVVLLAMLWRFGRREAGLLPDRRTLVYFTAATVVYLVVRTAVIGHVVQTNWGPGAHALRNLAGGLLYGVYPWALASLTGIGEAVRAPTHAVWPEILAIPVLVVLLGAGHLLRRSREVRVGLAWMLIALLPVCMFKFRFFQTDWLTHDRYYYLSSIGACFCIAAVMDGMWSVARWRTAVRAVVIVAVAVTIVGEPRAAALRAGRLDRMTKSYASLVRVIGQCMDKRSTHNTCAVDGWPMQSGFMEDVFALERPEWRVVAVDDEVGARAHKPCLYVRLFVEGDRLGSQWTSIE